jgi:Predicted transcriptional regulators
MAGIKDIAKGRSDIYRVSPYDLSVKPGWNSRDPNDPSNAEHIDNLARSIAEHGVKQPLTIYQEDGKFFVEDGHCRLEAALRAIERYGAQKDMLIPVRMGDKEATEQDRVLSQIIRNSGKPLSPIEMGTVFKTLRNLGMSDSEIARRSAVSRPWVSMLVDLVDMPPAITDLVRSGAISATLAIETVKDFGGDVQAAAEVLRGAVDAAKASGKDRATAKHVKLAMESEEGSQEPKESKTADERKPSMRVRLREIFRDLKDIHIDGSGSVTVTFTPDTWAEIVDLIGVEIGKEDSDII